MKALVFIDPVSGTSIEWDVHSGVYVVKTPDGLVITEFVHGNAQKLGVARNIARRWFRDEFPKLADAS